MQKENYRPPEKKYRQLPETGMCLLDLEAVVRKQVNRYVELGFHKEVYPYMDEADAVRRYREDLTLPNGINQPEGYKGRFDVPLVVDPRLTLSIQHAKSRPLIVERIKTQDIQNLADVPKSPYLVWIHDGQRYSRLSVEQTIHSLADDEVGSPQIDVTAIYLQHPEYFKGEGYKGAAVIATGSRSDRVWATYIDAYKGQPSLEACWLGPMVIEAGKATRGKDIIMLGKNHLVTLR